MGCTTRPPRSTRNRTSRSSSPISNGAFPDQARSSIGTRSLPRARSSSRATGWTKVFDAAIEECRARTKKHIALPPAERFTVEYVTGKSWSAYNWYKGEFTQRHPGQHGPAGLRRSRDRSGVPRRLSGAPRLQRAAREAPRARSRLGRVLGLPAVLAAVAHRGRHGELRHRRRVSRPRAARVRARSAVSARRARPVERRRRTSRRAQLAERLSYAGNEAARRYLNGEFTRAQAVDWLEQLRADDARARRAARSSSSTQYRSYVINYNLGEDLVREFIERRGGTADLPARRWQEFAALISSPRLPSGLSAGR